MRYDDFKRSKPNLFYKKIDKRNKRVSKKKNYGQFFTKNLEDERIIEEEERSKKKAIKYRIEPNGQPFNKLESFDDVFSQSFNDNDSQPINYNDNQSINYNDSQSIDDNQKLLLNCERDQEMNASLIAMFYGGNLTQRYFIYS